MNVTYNLARRHLDAGVSLIPIATDGTKRPASSLLPRESDHDRADRFRATWNHFRERLATLEEAKRWWGGNSPCGLAAVCGNVSLGGLELIDFDKQSETTYPAWLELVREESDTLLSRVDHVATPAGRHVWFVCGNMQTPGNAKLACLPSAPAGERTLIETRGEGGYALIPGGPLCCHHTGKPYVHDGGTPLHSLGDVSLEEREMLVRNARLFDRSQPKEDPLPRGKPGESCDLLPGSDYDLRGPDWSSILEPRGWSCVGKKGSERRWKRPGKDAPGWSATTGFCRGKDGADLLRVFSSNADPFCEGKAYGRFRALALLDHGGDLSACARELSRGGFGSQLRLAAKRLRPEDVERVLAVCREEPALVLSALLSYSGARKLIERVLRGESHG